MNIRTIIDKLTSSQTVTAGSHNKSVMTARDVKSTLGEDTLFVGLLRTFIKSLLTSSVVTIDDLSGSITDKIALKEFEQHLDNLSTSSGFTFMDSSAALLITISDYLKSINQALSDTFLNTEMLMSYHEAGSLLNSTKEIFNITMDSTFSAFNQIDQAVVKGRISSDGSDKFQGWPSWAGIDMVVTGIMGNNVRFLPDFGTISYSIHREKVNVNPLGTVSRRGYTAGPRIIAGSIIGVVLAEEPLRGLQPNLLEDEKGINYLERNASPYRENMLPDQLPAFDLLITIMNEYGHTARLALWGITITDTGMTSSIQDLQSEIVYQYTASDIDLITYIGYSSDAQSISLSLEAYKNRRERIDEGNTLHGSPFDVPEFWDVWDPDKLLMMEPGDLKLVDGGTAMQNAINAYRNSQTNNVIRPNRNIQAGGNVLAGDIPEVSNCEAPIKNAYACKYDGNGDAVLGSNGVPEIRSDTVTVGTIQYTYNGRGRPPVHLTTTGYVEASDEPSREANRNYCSVTNVITSNSKKTTAPAQFTALGKDLMNSGLFRFGWGWQTRIYSESQNIAYMELESPMAIQDIRIFYQSGVSTIKQDGTTYPAQPLHLNHMVMSEFQMRFQNFDGIWTAWFTFKDNLTTAANLTLPMSGALNPERIAGQNDRNMLTIYGINKLLEPLKSGMYFTKALQMKVTKLTAHPDLSSSTVGASPVPHYPDHTSIAAVVPIGKYKDMVEKYGYTAAQLNLTCRISLTNKDNTPVPSRITGITGKSDRIPLNLVMFEDGVGIEYTGNSKYYDPVNIVDYPITGRTSKNFPKEIEHWCWEPLNSASSSWIAGVKNGTIPINAVLMPQTETSFYLEDIQIVKGFARLDYNLTGKTLVDLPKYFRSPKVVRCTVYKASSNPDENATLRSTLTTNSLISQDYYDTLYGVTRPFKTTKLTDYTTKKAAVNSALDTWAAQHGTIVITTTLSDQKGRYYLNNKAPTIIEPESMLINATDTDVERIKARYRGTLVVAFKFEVIDVYEAKYQEDATCVTTTPPWDLKTNPYFAITEVILRKYTQIKSISLGNLSVPASVDDTVNSTTDTSGQTTPEIITLMTYNVKDCEATAAHSKIATTVVNNGVDIAVFTEIQMQENYTKDNGSDKAQLISTLKSLNTEMTATNTTNTYNDSKRKDDHIAIFRTSQFNLIESKEIPLLSSPFIDPVTGIAVSDDNGLTLDSLGTLNQGARPALYNKLEFKDNTNNETHYIHVFALHLKSEYKGYAENLALRRTQAYALHNYIESQTNIDLATENVIIIGDMNTATAGDLIAGDPSSTIYYLCHENATDPTKRMWPVNLTEIPSDITYNNGTYSGVLDHIIISDPMKIGGSSKLKYKNASVKVTPTALNDPSDHYPVFIDLEYTP